MAKPQTTSGASISQCIEPARRSPPGPEGGGSVRRWDTKTAVPTAAAAPAVISPASGCTTVTSTVTSVGPRMKTTSSMTDSKAKAVSRSALSETR